MTRSEAITYIHKFIKQANAEQLKNLICSTFASRCSINCPLRKNNSCECAVIEEDTKIKIF